MPETPLGRIPYPSGSQAPAAAADMMAAFMLMDSHMVLRAVDAADRDSRYADAPAGTLVVSPEKRAVWMKIGAGPSDWFPIYTDTDWVEQGFTLSPGWEMRGFLACRIVTNRVEIRADLVYQGADDIRPEGAGEASGDIPDTQLFSVPAEFRPRSGTWVPGAYRSSRTSGGITLNSAGSMVITDMNPSSRITAGDFLFINLSFFKY